MILPWDDDVSNAFRFTALTQLAKGKARTGVHLGNAVAPHTGKDSDLDFDQNLAILTHLARYKIQNKTKQHV